MRCIPRADVAPPFTVGPTEAERVDWRQQLFNQEEVGPITRVSMPAESITRLHGILLDIDPGLFRPEVIPDAVRSSPAKFFERAVAPWLDRDPALQGAEVIVSGRGLHLITRFAEPILIGTDAERMRWDAIVRMVQAALPTDPCAPGITALTRPVGSINGKNGVTVTRLREATPTSRERILTLYERMRDQPFSTVMRLLYGQTRVSPCPICAIENSTLSGLDRVGICYGKCGKAKLSALYGTLLAPPTPAKK
jgi:hypothetical protein